MPKGQSTIKKFQFKQ